MQCEEQRRETERKMSWELGGCKKEVREMGMKKEKRTKDIRYGKRMV
jgi:hypothetical protein